MTQDSERLFSQLEVNRIFGHIPNRTLLNWAQGGLIKWRGETQDGRGRLRAYSKAELHQIAVVDELTSLNFPLEIIKLFMGWRPDAWERMDQVFAIEKQKPGKAGMSISGEGVFRLDLVDPGKMGVYTGYRAFGTYAIVMLFLPAIAERVDELISQALL